MPIIYNGTNVKSVIYNGTNIKIAYYNGTKVFESTPATPDSYFTFELLEDGTYSIAAADYTNMPETTIIPSTYNGKAVTQIPDDGFRDCDTIVNVVIPNSITSAGQRAFEQCDKLINITIGSGLTSLSQAMFHDCTSLTSITIPDTITDIQRSVFENTNLRRLDLPKNLETIEDSVVFYCFNMYDGIWIDESNPNFETPDGVLYDKRTKTLIEAPQMGNSYSVREGTLSIGRNAFGFSYLDYITLPEGLTRIEEQAFTQASDLREMILPSSLTYLGRSAFSGCQSLTSIVVPDGVTEIQGDVFNSTGLTNISVGSRVTSIGNGAFWNASSLSTFVIHTPVPPTLDGYAFEGGVPDNMIIYVPAGSVEAYKAAPVWSNRKDYIQAIPDPSSTTRTIDLRFENNTSGSWAIKINDVLYTGTDSRTETITTSSNAISFTIEGTTQTQNLEYYITPPEYLAYYAITNQSPSYTFSIPSDYAASFRIGIRISARS